ncbi:MAG TPA: mechanosensitive ion channel family protein [Thermoplasmata archaeon]|nr:mechanosensitive ion channel family protein [Thermoplasmata archaeon]
MTSPPRTHIALRFALELLGTVAVGIGLGALVYFGVHALCHNCLGANTALFVDLIEAAAIIFVGYLFGRAFRRAVEAAMGAVGHVRGIPSVHLLIQVVVGALVFLALLTIFGVTNVSSILTGSAFVGIVLGLAGQTVLGNIFAGFIIVLAGPFHPGERIGLMLPGYPALAPTYAHELLLPQLRGVVRDVGLFYTVVQLDEGRLTRIPNGVVYASVVTNLTGPQAHLVRVRATLPRTTPVSLLEEAVRAYAQAHPTASDAVPQPRVLIVDLSPTTWDGVVEVWTPAAREDVVRDAVLREVVRLGGIAATPAV